MEYLPRLIDKRLEKYLDIMGAVSVVGPKWCGKTTTAKRLAKSVVELDDPDKGESYLRLADIKPSLLLKGEKPRLIDEWQLKPSLWDGVRISVDDAEKSENLYILTSSTAINEEEIMHTGIGRIRRVSMYPMSLYESRDSNGKISLKQLFEDKDLDITGIESDLALEDILHVICRGGWPRTLAQEDHQKQYEISTSYVDSICQKEASRIDGVKRDPEKVRRILQSYARNLSTLTKNTQILRDVNKYKSIDKTTYYSYLDVLKRLFVISDIRGWTPNIRPITAMRSEPKRQFIDPSIATAVLDLTPEKLIQDPTTFESIFKNLCMRDLIIYSQKLGGSVYYYSDQLGLEVDCVLHLNNGEYGLISFGLCRKVEERCAKNLLRLDKLIKDKIRAKKINFPKPSLLAVITITRFAYTRKDGVKIIPITCLKD